MNGMNRPYQFKDRAARMSQYLADKAINEEALKNKIPFISPRFLPDFYLTRGLVIVGGQSGQSKSTTCANMAAGYLENTPQDKNIVIISNEENSDAIYSRIACILVRKSYIDYYNSRLSPMDMAEVDEAISSVMDRVEVVKQDEEWHMGILEDVEDVITSCASSDVSIVLVDYLQTITSSRYSGQMTSVEVSKKFGLFLKECGQLYSMPIVVFVQLVPAESTSSMMSHRIQNDHSFFNHAFIAIEVRPDFKTSTSIFKVHKSRSSEHTGKEVMMKYVGGRYLMNGEDIRPL